MKRETPGKEAAMGIVVMFPFAVDRMKRDGRRN